MQMNWKRIITSLAASLSITACFHQVVQTGLAAGTPVVEKAWVSTWLWGLVAAAPIDVRTQCRSGVATVETQQSFGNGIASILTLGIWSPQNVRITCASRAAALPAGMREIVVAPNGTSEEQTAAFAQAVEESALTHRAVMVRFSTQPLEQVQ